MKPAKIRYLLDLNDKSQIEIARELGVDPAVVTRVINGTTKSRNVAAAISEAINTDLDKAFPRYESANKAA